MTPGRVTTDGDRESAERSTGCFATTHWSVVLAAGDSAAPGAQEALERLCRTYWYPLYAYVRRTGRPHNEAQDLTQGFFEHLLKSRLMASADAAKGRFRSFLLKCFRNYMSSEHVRSSAQKRGGGQPVLSLDETSATARYAEEMADQRSPELLYERDWAVAVLNEAMLQLESEFAAGGRKRTFEALRPGLQGDDEDWSVAAAAWEISTTEATVRVMVHRLRKRYREVLSGVVLRTVGSPAEVEEELRHLLEVVQG